MTTNLVYLSGPITAKNNYSVEQNVAAAVKVYLQLLEAGVWPICPHLSAAFPSAFAVPYERWLEYDFALIDACSHVLMLERWEASAGAVREHDYAVAQGKTIVYDVRLLT